MSPAEHGEIAEFLDEATQNLHALEAGLTAGCPDADVGALFRAAHSIKGLAGMLGLDRITTLTHDLETLLDRVRDGKLELSGQVCTTAIGAVDLLTTLLEDLAEGEPDRTPIDAVCRELEAAFTNDPHSDGDAATSTVASGPTPPFLPDGLTEFLEVDALIAEGQGLTVYAVGTTIDPQGLTDHLKGVEAVGEVIQIIDRAGWHGAVVAVPEHHDLRPLARWRILASQGTCERMVDDADDAPLDLKRQEPKPDIDTKRTLLTLTGKGAAAGTLRVDANRLDELFNASGELVVARAMLADRAQRLEGLLGQLVGDQHPAAVKAYEMMEQLIEQVVHVGRCASQVQRQSMGLRMVPLGPVMKRFHRVVREVSRVTGHAAELELVGEAVEIDKQLVDELVDPLTHLVRNAVDHGLESETVRRQRGKPATGHIRLEARRDGGQIAIALSDDGGGIDADRIRAKAVERGLVPADEAEALSRERCLDLMFSSGFSTAAAVTGVSGRGVGLDIVRARIESLKGTVSVDSEPGRGTTFTIRLPLTLSICKVQLVELGGAAYGVPMDGIREVVQFSPHDCVRIQSASLGLRLRGRIVTVADRSLIGHLLPVDDPAGVQTAILIHAAGRSMLVPVDRVLGEAEVVVKALPGQVAKCRGVAGASILGDGRVALVMDVPSLFDALSNGADHGAAA